ncbi:MAG: nucleotide exchange factor GrpE [Chloroflexota bacterium]|nr:nucleotide exchange factor GrpE [Chloroflexota bacterium]
MTERKNKRTETLSEEEEGEVQVEIAEQGEKVVEETAASGEEVEEAGDELEKLRVELEEARTQASEYLDGWQRTQAEFSNYKKRQETERVQVTALANATLLRKLLPVVDDFERASATLPADLSKLTWCEGIFLIQHKLYAVLESEGAKPIETEEQTFDPRYHEAVTHEQVSGYDEGQIIGEVQRGYMLGERVLRPALVRVAKEPAAPQPEPSEE